MANRLKQSLPFLLLAIGVVYLYRNIFHGFFQQDEWFSYGYFVLNKNLGLSNFIKFIFAPNVTHYNPITVFIEYVLFSLWGMNYMNFMILGLMLHLIAIFAVYFLTLKIFKNDKFLAFCTSFLFGIFASTYQGAAWVIVDIATIVSTILGIISTYSFIVFLEKFKSKYFLFSMVFLLVSLFIKEITIGLFPLFLILWFLNRSRKKSIKYLVSLFGIGFIYFFFRVAMVFLSHGAGGGLATDSQPFKDLIYNFLSIPFKSLSQIIIPSDFMHSISEHIAMLLPLKITGMQGSPDFENFVVKRVMEAFSLLISFLILVISTRKINYVTIFSLCWVFINSLIIALSPGRTGLITVVDSRNLYFISVGVAIYLVFIAKSISRKDIKKLVLILAVILTFNIYWLNKNLNTFVEAGDTRKIILNKIVTENPVLPGRVVFYTESDSPYYGLPENIRILPFQSGFGQTLLAWYQRTSNFPKGFFTDNFLWPIDSEGYKEINGIGFGYFRNFIDLTKFFELNKSNEPTLIAYSFNSQNNFLRNNTKEILGRIDGYEAKKKILNSSNFIVTSSQNSNDIGNVIDGNIKTLWSSQLAYMNYQYILIDMRRSFNVAEVVIDSYNDQNQNGVGYRIEVSNDKETWNIMFESKRYPPDPKGKDNLYFKPTSIRFMKIVQVGYHKYAPWVINELSVYEKL